MRDPARPHGQLLSAFRARVPEPVLILRGQVLSFSGPGLLSETLYGLAPGDPNCHWPGRPTVDLRSGADWLDPWIQQSRRSFLNCVSGRGRNLVGMKRIAPYCSPL